ncbi:cathepsin B-like cysteine proteinase 3 [Acyrthosiphon pisum]|uniref:Peptidase C1A papain C-terminal domain-containing protein n=1 Tax=Acyrthosiphon pisum TaxID=7029 RepID=A0A8R1W167_ACYPI|nr:cathepsin B-like cysteine proteinase 3 [Acyrthosiphon pisum]|eukprot:XP_001948185.1 PREDICTED: cathepsin B-like cysteine proteinase 3 [Acyrthosiphon pisum]
MAKILFLMSIMLLSCYLTEQAKLSRDNMIQTNIETNTLKALDNIDLNSAKEEHLMLLGKRGVAATFKSKLLYKTRDPRYVAYGKISKEFDARKHWSQCKTIGEVYNDGNSDLSWAYATTGAFADRMCVATNGSYNQLLSTEQLISCSGIKSNAMADDQAWKFFKKQGLVSGGKYNTNDGCQPSKIPPIFNLPKKIYNRTCDNFCYGNSLIDYNHDHVKVSYTYHVLYKNIQREVQTYGPVSAYFSLYDDLFLYTSGVYARTEKSKFVRYQSAKLIGWGVENGVDYWLLVNSWGNEWGQNGLFKIKRGTDECQFGRHTYAGVPKM